MPAGESLVIHAAVLLFKGDTLLILGRLSMCGCVTASRSQGSDERCRSESGSNAAGRRPQSCTDAPKDSRLSPLLIVAARPCPDSVVSQFENQGGAFQPFGGW